MTACGAHDCVWRAQAAAEVAARTIDANRKHTHFLSAPTRHGHATGRDLPSAPGWSAGANDPTEISSQGTNQARRGSRPDSARRRSLTANVASPRLIVTAHAAPKIAMNNRSPCDKDHNQRQRAPRARLALASEGPTAVSSRTYFESAPTRLIG